MAGIAGAVIGLLIGSQPNIAPTQAVADGTTTSRGCTTNFIGFGLGLTSIEEIEDFNATDDVVGLAISGGGNYEPDYTSDVLSWKVVV